jgi:hypothetical protein
MRYIQPRITSSTVATLAIQGGKVQNSGDSSQDLPSIPAYEADE